jgi:hypothetical protein
MKSKIHVSILLLLLTTPAFAQHTFSFGLNGQFAYDFTSLNSSSKEVKSGPFLSQLVFAPGASLRYAWNPYWNMELGADMMTYVTSYHAEFPSGNASAAMGNTGPRLLYMVNFKVLRKNSKYISVGAGISYQYIPGGGGGGSMSVESAPPAPDAQGASQPSMAGVSDSSNSSSIQAFYPCLAIGFGKEFKSGSELAIRINYQYGYKALMEDQIKAFSNGSSFNTDLKNKGTFLSLGLYYTFRPIGSRRKAKS